MSLALIRLFLSGALKKLAGLNIWQLLLIAALIFGGVQTLRLKAEQRHAHKVEAQLSKSEAARKADRDAYAKAQAQAAVANKAQVAKIEQQSRKVSDDERQAYLDDLARLRSLRLRQQAAPRPANGAGSPAPSAPAAGADADGLPLPSADDVQAASEIELRLMHLQDWVLKQIAVDPNGAAK